MVKKVTTDMSLTANGLHDWLIQRFSALVLAIYFLVLVSFFLLHPTLDFSTWQGFFAHRWMQVATLIVLLSLFVHVWVGIWTVVTDYVNPASARFAVQVLVILSLIIYFFWGIAILWRSV